MKEFYIRIFENWSKISQTMLLFLKSEEADRKNWNSIWFHRYIQNIAVLGR